MDSMGKYIDELALEIEENLVRGFSKNSRDRLERALHYAVSVRGKRLRPLLFLTLLQALDRDPRPCMDIACSIEYIHTYSLIHDDLPVMDDDDLRRGQPTVHVAFDEPIALLAGDTLLTIAFERMAHSGLKPAVIVALLKIITRSIGVEGMAGGQALDLDFDGHKEEIFTIQKKKTADLITGVFLMAGSIAGLDEERLALLREAGRSIGVAFQMADDLLDLEGEEEKVGKRLKKDGKNRSPNSVIYYGRDTIKEYIRRDYGRTVELMEQLGIAFEPFLTLIRMMVYRDR